MSRPAPARAASCSCPAVRSRGPASPPAPPAIPRPWSSSGPPIGVLRPAQRILRGLALAALPVCLLLPAGPPVVTFAGEGTAPRPEAPAAIDDGAFVIPGFPAEPRFGEARTEHGYTVASAELTYWKTDGREVGPWRANLYRPAAPGHALSMSRTGAGAAGTADAGSAGPAAEAARLPLVLLLPLGGEKSDLDAFLARRFVENGFAVLALRAIPRAADEGVMHSLRDTARTFTEDVANLLRVLGWARGLPGVDPGRIGLLGVSRGAIGAAVALQVAGRGAEGADPSAGSAPERPGSGEGPPAPPGRSGSGVSAVLVLGGAGMAGLFRTSRMGNVERLRANELARAGGDLDRAAARAAAILRNVDPASRPGRLDPALTLLVNARSDHVIPKEQALALREAAGGATQAWLPFGHNASLLFAHQVRRLALEHFLRTLRTPRMR